MEGRLDGVRVLVVDDDADVQEAIEMALRAEGARTKHASDGNAAVAACLEDAPDVVVLDMMLPKRSGFLVLEKIKGREESPVVVMVTANEGRRHQAYAESLGVDGYLLKPVPLERLIEVIEELMEGRPLQRDLEQASVKQGDVDDDDADADEDDDFEEDEDDDGDGEGDAEEDEDDDEYDYDDEDEDDED